MIKLKLFWLQFKILGLVIFRAFKARVAGLRTRVAAADNNIKFVTAKAFLLKYPASKSCKHCSFGQGFNVVTFPDKHQDIAFCRCVMKQYTADLANGGQKVIVRGIE